MRPDVERLFKFFLRKNFNPSKRQPLFSSITTAQSYTIRKIINTLGDPENHKDSRSIVKWGDKIKSQNPGFYKYLSNPNNLAELKKSLEAEKLAIYNHPYFKTRMELGHGQVSPKLGTFPIT